MLMNEDQRYFLTILRETGCVGAGQVLPLLRIRDPTKEQYQADAMLRGLRYQGKAVTGEDGMIRIPGRDASGQDAVMRLALDALIALSPKKLLHLSGGSGIYPLRFMLERRDGWADHFAFVPIPPGQEARLSQLLQAEKAEYVFLLYLEELEQYKSVYLSRSHYFVVGEGQDMRFYKGGGS